MKNSDWGREIWIIHSKRHIKNGGVSQPALTIKRFPVFGTKISRQQVMRFHATQFKFRRFHHHQVCMRLPALIWSWNQTPNHQLNLIYIWIWAPTSFSSFPIKTGFSFGWFEFLVKSLVGYCWLFLPSLSVISKNPQTNKQMKISDLRTIPPPLHRACVSINQNHCQQMKVWQNTGGFLALVFIVINYIWFWS